MRLFWFLLVVVGVGCVAKKDETPQVEPDASAHHGDHKMAMSDETLMISSEPARVEAGKPVRLRLMIHDASGVVVKQFDVMHEKRMHLIIVRDGLDFFAHVHPDIDADGNITITHTFPVGGKYRLYADHKSVGKSQSVPIAEIEVAGEAPAAPQLVKNVPGKANATDLNADIGVINAKAGAAADITFDLTNFDGKPVNDLEPYLGAMGHLVILSADGKQFVHAHPEENSTSKSKVMFMAHFAQPGTYKGWGQFQRAGQVLTVPFVLDVK